MKTTNLCFIGVDTHKFSHTAALMDQNFQFLGFVDTKALPTCYPHFIKKVKQIAQYAKLIFGLEDICGFGASLYRFLHKNDLEIREINPVKTNQERLHKTHPDKSDPDDALDIAKVLAQQWKSLPNFHRDDKTQALQCLNRQRDDLVHQLIAAKNRLHAALHQVYPGYRSFFPAVFNNAALTFWRLFPTPAHLKYLGLQKLTSAIELSVSHCKARAIANTILAHIADKNISNAIKHAYEHVIPDIVDTIQHVQSKIEIINTSIEKAVLDTPYKIHTMQGVGFILAANIIAQVSPIQRFPSADKLARFMGIAPRKWGTAKRIRHHASLKGRRSLNQTFYLIALSQITINRNGKPRCPKARAYYLRKIKEGKSHLAALKCLQRRLVDVIYAMMKNESIYNPNMSKSKI